MDDVGLNRALERFAGSRVFLTGDTGFKGSWLAYWLTELGAEVTGYALPPERADDLFHVLRLDALIAHQDGDVRDAPALERALSAAAPQYVFHLAAQSLVKRSYRDPVETFATNVQGTVHLLDAVRRQPSIRSVIIVTSDKCYQNREWTWGYRETDTLGGHDPYSASKAAAEIVIDSFRSSYGDDISAGIASVRAGNVIGGGDLAEARIVPDCIRALRAGEPLELRRPEARRPWQHVLEPLGGYLLLAERLAEAPQRYAGAWNFGPPIDAVRTVEEVAEGIFAGWGGRRLKARVGAADFHETNVLRLNIDKAATQLGWRPRWSFEQAIAQTAGWYRAQSDGADMRAVTSRQTRDYVQPDGGGR